MIFDYNQITGLVYTSPTEVSIVLDLDTIPKIDTEEAKVKWTRIQLRAGLPIIDSEISKIDNDFFYPVIKTNGNLINHEVF